MESTEIANQIIRLLSERTGIPTEHITPDTKLKDLEMDSLDTVEGFMEIEDILWVKFADHEMSSFNTVGDVIESVTKKKVFAD